MSFLLRDLNDQALLVPGRYNIVAVGGSGRTAILYKDGEHFAIGTMEPYTKPVPLPGLLANGFFEKGWMVRPDRPIPLRDLSEWHEKATSVDIPHGVGRA